MSAAIRAYADAFIACVKSSVPKGGFRSFYVSLRIEVNDHSTDDEFYPVGGYLHLACYAPSNYMKVYAAFTSRPEPDLTALPWQLACSHDSAWREDGIQSTLTEVEAAILDRASELFNKPIQQLSPYTAIERMELADDRTRFWEELSQSRNKSSRLDIHTLLKAQTLAAG